MLSVEGLTKRYDEKNGIEGVDFSCENGRAVAVIGPNGAGKSTLLKIMAGVLGADAGCVRMDGRDTGEFESRRHIGYLPDRTQLARGLTAGSFLRMVCDYKFDGRYKEEAREAVALFGLEEQQDREFCRLSMGNQKKTAIIAAFLGTPGLILLDEPTNGVDTSGILALKQTVKAARERGSIVVISSHMLDFVGGICDKSIFLKDGRVAAVEEEGGRLEERYRTLYLSTAG